MICVECISLFLYTDFRALFPVFWSCISHHAKKYTGVVRKKLKKPHFPIQTLVLFQERSL